MGRQNIYCGRIEKGTDNWAVKVGDDLWNISADFKQNPIKLVIIKQNDEEMSQMQCQVLGDAKGTTTHSEGEISGWLAEYSSKHPVYDSDSSNSQHCVTEFIKWLSDGNVQLGKDLEDILDGVPDNEAQKGKGKNKDTVRPGGGSGSNVDIGDLWC